MALSQEQVNALASAMAGARTKSGLSVVTPTGPTQKATVKEPYQKSPNTLQQIGQKVGATAGFVGKLAKGIGSYAVREIKEIPGEVYRTATNVIPTVTGGGVHAELRAQNMKMEALDKIRTGIFNSYKRGELSKSEYTEQLKQLGNGFKEIGEEAQKTVEKADPMRAVEDFTDSALLVTSLGFNKVTSGAGKATFFGKQVNPKTAKAVQTINKSIESRLQNIPGNYFKKMFATEFNPKNIGKIGLSKTISASDDITKAVIGETLKEVATKDVVKATANKLFIKFPLTYHTIYDDANLILNDISQGDFKGALGIAALDSMGLLGGIVSASVNATKKFGLSSKRAMFGTNSFFDELSGRTAGGDRSAIGRIVSEIKTSDSKRYEEATRWMKSLQAANLYAARDDVAVAVNSVESWFKHHGVNLVDLEPKEVFEQLEKYGKTLDILHRDLRLGLVAGVEPHQINQVVLGRFDQKTRDAFADMIAKAPDKQAALTLLQGAAEKQVVWTHNDLLYAKIREAIETMEPNKAAKAIKAIDAGNFAGKGWSKEARTLMKENGYIPVIPKRIQTRYFEPEKAANIVSDYIDDGVSTYKPLPGLETLGKAFRGVGLSPEDTTSMVNNLMRANLDDALDSISLPSMLGESKGTWVANRLSQYMENLPQFPGRKLPAQDARTLTVGEIQKALSTGTMIPRETAKEVQKAILQSYTSLPLAIRGLGDKLVDYAYAVNPLQRAYSRLQGALRYSWNPFFRLQEITETEILSQAISGGKIPQTMGINPVINMFFKQTGQQIDDTVKLLDNRQVFSGTLGGEAAQDAVIGRISANLTKTQKRSLAGLTLKIAKTKGIPVEQLLNENYDEVVDALRVIVQYPTKGAINSPLAKTMNLAFFPTRYNFKVTALAAKAIANQPPAVQLAVVNGMLDFKNWLQSDEGIQWQSENQDAIRIMKWLTPYGSIERTLQTLNGNKPESIGELGQLGGLPFGLITQMIDSQTDFEVNTPYLDLKTGKVFPEYVPETTKARAATAIQDVINQVFTYPGRLIGLPGKTELIRKGVKGILPTETEEYKITVPEDTDLTKTQQNQLRVLNEQGITRPDIQTYPYVYDGYSWNDSGYFIPVDIKDKLSSVKPANQPSTVVVPSKADVKKKSSSKTKPNRVARPIEKR